MFGKFLEIFIFFCEGVYNESQIDTFHTKHKNSEGNHTPLGPNSQFSFLRAVGGIPFVESIDWPHCMTLYNL